MRSLGREVGHQYKLQYQDGSPAVRSTLRLWLVFNDFFSLKTHRLNVDNLSRQETVKTPLKPSDIALKGQRCEVLLDTGPLSKDFTW